MSPALLDHFSFCHCKIDFRDKNAVNHGKSLLRSRKNHVKLHEKRKKTACDEWSRGSGNRGCVQFASRVNRTGIGEGKKKTRDGIPRRRVTVYTCGRQSFFSSNISEQSKPCDKSAPDDKCPPTRINIKHFVPPSTRRFYFLCPLRASVVQYGNLLKFALFLCPLEAEFRVDPMEF
ncbi:hypothetical protein L596_023447 [Steinernema carpocapsae]|uniref:Uncharacterized protein n=1 Tax=Steinernema carpocapsae TaxID=34508 RepID=A0A4U5MDN6_STECR|nr:hypothetical protein L596_023447 [Steinernema carpocapsae]